MSFSEDLFWGDVAGDNERLAHRTALTHGKVAVSAYWPFLASATDFNDFENRLHLTAGRFSELVDPSVLPDVISALRDDYSLVTGAKNPFAKKDDDDKDDKKSDKSDSDDDDSDDDKDDDKDKDDSDNDSDDSDDDDKDDKDDKDDNTPPWLKDKKKTASAVDEHVTRYNAWAKSKGHDPDEVSTLKKYEKEPGISRKHVNDIADQQYIGGGDVDWRKNGGIKPEHAHHATNYHPDPTASWRYYQPYESLEGAPLNNGDLQDSDGFPKDLAQGEDRSTPKIDQEITPGTWSLGQGMPERPMPQGVERGYQPVASYQQISEAGCPDCGQKWGTSSGSSGFKELHHASWCPGLKEFDPHHEGPDETETKRKADVYSHLSPMASRIDKEGFLVESLVDPAVGAPVPHNPFYFSTDSQGLTGNGFPVDPWGSNIPDRANDYGDVQPDVSSGSEEGQVDGKGYSRTEPGNHTASRNFNVVADTDGKIHHLCPGCDKPLRKHTTAHGDEFHHLHNDSARCFPKHSLLEDAVAEGAAADMPSALEHSPSGGGASDSTSDGTEADPDWAADATKAAYGSLQFFDPHLAADYIGRPDANNPTGRGPDEFKARTWNAYETTRPMQQAEDRNVNTPVLPAEPLKTRNVNSPNPGENVRNDRLEQSGGEDDEEGED